MKIKNILPYLLIILTIPSIAQWLNADMDNLTSLWWILYTLVLYLFISGKKHYFRAKNTPLFIKIFLFLVILEALYGFTLAEGYYDYKFLINNSFTFLLPLSIYYFSDPDSLSRALSKWFVVALPAFFLFIPVMQSEAIGKYLVPILFGLLFLKPLPLKNKIIVLLFFSFIFILGSLGSRSNVIKYFVALLMGLSLYTFVYRLKLIIRSLHLIIIFTPFVLLYLGMIGSFNVFKIDEYLSGDFDIEVQGAYDVDKVENLSSDTRTFIYEEAILSAINENYVIQGNSLARGYKSKSFAFTDFYGRGERNASEVSIINVFTYFGILGVFTYFGIFLSATYKAIYKSNSTYMKVVGFYVTFRWFFAWIEDFSRFDLNYLFLWIMIAMCFSPQFRSMNNSQFEIWVRSIFVKYKVKNN
jgi:hypothetical protein